MKWDVNGKELRIIEPTGGIWVPTADEIYAALVEGKPVEDVTLTSVLGLRMSRYRDIRSPSHIACYYY